MRATIRILVERLVSTFYELWLNLFNYVLKVFEVGADFSNHPVFLCLTARKGCIVRLPHNHYFTQSVGAKIVLEALCIKDVSEDGVNRNEVLYAIPSLIMFTGDFNNF